MAARGLLCCCCCCCRLWVSCDTLTHHVWGGVPVQVSHSQGLHFIIYGCRFEYEFILFMKQVSQAANQSSQNSQNSQKNTKRKGQLCSSSLSLPLSIFSKKRESTVSVCGCQAKSLIRLLPWAEGKAEFSLKRISDDIQCGELGKILTEYEK